ncbi:hypothetical protein OG599_04395 [Streptomyces sp. NBC_01335]|nr:hypothetical protein OG599_04395 [Streptomyces sp. NBC_01335]
MSASRTPEPVRGFARTPVPVRGFARTPVPVPVPKQLRTEEPQP